MFNSILKSGLLAFLLAVTTVKAVLPPQGRTNPTEKIIEFPLAHPIVGSPNQLWDFFPDSENSAIIELVQPKAFLSCSPPIPGTQCAGKPLFSDPTSWVVSQTSGGFLIVDTASGLALTGTGVSGQPVFLSFPQPSSTTSEQVWVFIQAFIDE
ncbi:hypothetical protein BDP27DRAFT_1428776 [Rhodocollybia butyracea]|uniref:Uncharacterized protein n=1 Tax=Rhodocollybia butyracea TaxID=206335 RepID=A0A9P5PE18_9AGAR|nr:hypothetical protein BDP27DRAFT_1428776 [Rhodocollybia butyracea]